MCSKCPPETRAKRRCSEPREDFTIADGIIWPMYITKGGTLYNYCPGKATWDPVAASIYKALVICAETGIMYEDGPLSEQPVWWTDLLSWFLPYYREKNMHRMAEMMLGAGSGSDSKAMAHAQPVRTLPNGTNDRRPPPQNKR